MLRNPERAWQRAAAVTIDRAEVERRIGPTSLDIGRGARATHAVYSRVHVVWRRRRPLPQPATPDDWPLARAANCEELRSRAMARRLLLG